MVVLRPDEVLSRAGKLCLCSTSMFCKREYHIGIITIQQNDKSTQIVEDVCLISVLFVFSCFVADYSLY